MGGGGGGKGWSDWAMLASNPVQAAIPEIFGIRDWDPISSGFSYLTGKITNDPATDQIKPTYGGGPGYQTPTERTTATSQKQWEDYYKALNDQMMRKYGSVDPSQTPNDNISGSFLEAPTITKSRVPRIPASGSLLSSNNDTDEESGSLLT